MIVQSKELTISQLTSTRVPILCLLTNGGLTTPPGSFIRGPRLNTVISGAHSTLLIRTKVIQSIRRTIKIRSRMVTFRTISLIRSRVRRNPTLRPRFVFRSLSFKIVGVVNVRPMVNRAFFDYS